ncbi:MAG: chitobiase/beta-hexosaminidase C-terminal domain-containing protein [Paludibacteraceae bacterium]|nr:chitobiase/beta-hexosaminidase C-terminal domain-containing protein [Paludibacteraceae bacterium]
MKKANLLLNRSGDSPDVTRRQCRNSLESIVSRFSLVSLICVLMLTLGVGNVWGAEVVYKTAKFGTQADSGTSSNYTSTWTSTYNGFSVTVANGNTNGTSWNHVRFGRNKTASTGRIEAGPIDKKITKVTLTINAVNTTGTNSIKLYTSTNGSTWTERGSFTLSTGAQTVTIAAGNQAINLYYKIEFNCNNKVSSNGFDQIAQVDYYYDNSSGSTCATPTFSPVAGTLNNNQSITISSATSGSTIHYTTDGSTTPTTSSPSGTAGTATASYTVSPSNPTIKAIAVKAGSTNSAVATATYTFKCATPTFSVAGGTYGSAQSVSLSCTTTDAVIHYTTDGTTPTSSSPTYSSAITVDASMTIKAIAIKTNYTNSDVASADYTIEIPYTVSFSTGSGNPTVSPITESEYGDGIELPDGPTPACSGDGWAFDGWATASCSSTTTAPVLYMPGDTYYPTADNTMYAVYRKLTSGTSTATFAAADITNLTAHPVYSLDWRENSSGVELYIDDGQRYTGSPNTWTINKSQWGLIDGHRKISSVAVTLSGDNYKINSVTAYGGGSASLSTSGTSQTISCSGEVTQLKLTATSSYQIRMTTFTVTYYNATFDSNPTCKDVKSISVQTAPTKLTYCAGDMFDPTGLVIRVTYTDDSYENVAYSGHESDFSFTPSTSTALTTGNTSVIITYRSDKTTTQAITVNTAYTITLTGSGTVTGGTISADNSSACAGSTITLTATPSTHYTFSSWNVTSGGSPVTVTSNQFTMPSGNVTVNATFTEDAYRTVVFKSNKQALFDDGGSATTFDGTNKWKQKVYLTEKPVWPTDLISGQACDATSTEFKGWVADGQTWTGKEASVPVGSTLITSASGFAAAASGSGDVVYHAVWAKGTSSVVEQTASFGFEEASPSAWTITNINQYSDYSATGDYSGKPGDNGSGTILSPVTIMYNTKLSTPISISFKSSKSNNKSNDSNWHVQSSSDGSSWSTVTDGTGPTNSELSQGVFSNPFEVDLSSLSNVYIRIEHGGASPASLLDDIVLTYEAGGTTYSDYLTTCCENLVAISDGTLSHCTLSYSNTSQPTCSETASDRQVTITVTPDAGYEMTSSARLTWTKTSGTAATATHVSGPTGSGPYTFVYEFNQDDSGAGTFDATCTPKTYTITFDQSTATTAGTSSVDVVFNDYLPAIPSLPSKTDYNFAGYFTQEVGGTQFVGSTGTWYTVSNWINSDKEWIKADNKTLYPHWTEKSLVNYRTNCPSFDVFNQDGTSAADIHLTSTKDVAVYASSAAGNLIRIIASGLDANGNHPKIGVEYYDANNGDALVTGTDRVFRLSNSSTYDYENDLLDLGENTTEYDQKFSICYTPKDYNQSHHYKLKLILRNNNTEKDNVTIHLYGRSLPKEFVIAAKSGDTWYALPNTLAATEGAQGAISPTAITVDNATTPTKAVNPIGTVIYGACNKYTNDNRSGLRFTSDGAHWAQTSATTSVYKMWLSNTGYTNAQDWYLKSTDLSAYEVFMDPIGSPDDKRRIELYNSSGVKMGYHNTGSGNARTGIGNIYLLPVEFPSITAHIMEWGTDHVVVDLRTPGSSTKVKTQISGGTIGDEQSLESVKKDEGVYRLAVTLSSSDALKDLKLYFYNISDVLQGVAEFTIPRIVSSTTTTGSFGTPFKKDAPFVDLVILNGATLTVSETTDGTKFIFRDLYVYGNAKMVVPSGTYIDFSNVYLRGGHLNSSWNYVYSHPQLVLNGTMGNTSNTINYDYLTNNAQFYSLALPYDVTLSTIVNPDFNNKQSWLIHAYDGALRASGSQVSGWYDVEEGSTTGSIAPLGPTDELTAGVGYTFFGAPQKVNSIRQKWSVNRFPMTLASGSAEGAKSGVSVTAHGMTDGELNDGVAPNDAGWNMLGNPFLADIGGTESYETAVKGTILSYHNVKTLDANGNWTGGWHWEENETNVRYVRIPNDLGTEYEQVRFKDAILRAFHHFFIQAGATGTFSFDLATRAQSAPQRIKRGKLILPDEMDVDFRLSKGDVNTKFGLTLCDDFSSDYVMNEDIAEDLSGEAMKAYTLILGQRVTYNGLPYTAAQQIIPVGFRAPNAGEYIFSYQEDDNTDNMEHIYLTDKRLGVVTDLKDQSYKFASEIGVVDDRFVLQIVFRSDVTTDTENMVEQGNGRPVKFIYQDKIFILRNGIIYDITGKRVREINK